MKSNIDFVKLSREELSQKIALLVSKRARVVFWKHNPKFYEGIAFHIQTADKIILTITEAKSFVKLQDEKICLNIVIQDVDYFFSGKVIEHAADEDLLRIEMFDECFRLEKRSRERLQTYPKYDVYAYLKYEIDNPKNVISFNKTEQKGKDFLNKLNESRLQKMMTVSSDLEIGEEEDILGFRVEDITSNGISFFASYAEKENVLDKFQDKNFPLTVNFESEAFTLTEAKIVYVMDYINPDFAGANMYKVGVTFKHSPSLKRRIEDISGINLDTIDYQKEFEEFIKNE